MPLYDYCCTACGTRTTARASFDANERPCPSCAQPAKRDAVNRIGVTGFAFVPFNQRPLRIDRFMNAHGDLLNEAGRKGVEPPDLYSEAKRRVATGQAAAEAGAR